MLRVQDCVSLADALREHGAGSPAVRRAAQAVTAARRPAALAAACLAAYAATPRDPLSQLLSGLRFHVLLACGSSFSGLLPWEVTPHPVFFHLAYSMLGYHVLTKVSQERHPASC